jgi:hypothetical protein
MSISARQTNLLVNQDWKTVYQSFREADFQSYDFETLRKTMIDYLRTYYPEDFNDFTESSEYIALIDLIAFLGQSLSFRADLNARENFFDTAERRDSILKLARLISYNAKRNTPASGLLKIDRVSTTETVTDSNGLDLSNLVISWNDSANQDWQEQFTTILNAALVSNQIVGNPGNGQVITGIQTDEYSVNLVPGLVPTYNFAAVVDGNSVEFEAVSCTSAGESYVYEDAPTPRGRFNILNRNDNLGNGSVNTGFFVMFKQGKLNTIDFNLTQSLPNRVVNVDNNNINNTDVWLYQLDANGNPSAKWNPVPAVAGINVVYNRATDRNLYQVNSKANDQIDLVFGDGAFSNIPQGIFRLFYRVSNGLRYKITPDEMQGVTIPISYISRNNRVETLTLRCSLNYTVANADRRELASDIRVKAPQQYYTQNRMITGEDYNLFPYTNFNSILKVKAVNRSSSGTSRYLDVLDATGKYSSTNIFASDGWLYTEARLKSYSFTFQNVNDINNVIYNQLGPALTSTELKHFYYDIPENKKSVSAQGLTWYPTSTSTNSSSGYIVAGGSTPQDIGMLTNSTLKYVVPGCLIKFTAPAGQFFNTRNQLVTGTPIYEGERTYIYATVANTGVGSSFRLTENVPIGAVIDTIVPVFKSALPGKAFADQIAALIQSYKNFGLRYDIDSQSWQIVQPQNLSNSNIFSLTYTGDDSSQGLDASWLVKFTYNGANYSFSYRNLDYVFESLAETRFHFDPDVKVYDSRTGTTLRDQVKVLKVNTQADTTVPIGQDQTWYIYKSALDVDGFENTTKIYITFPDTDNDGVPDDIDLFNNIVQPDVNPNRKFVYFRSTVNTENFITYIPVDNNTVNSGYTTQAEIREDIEQYLPGQIFYAVTENKFYELTVIGTVTPQRDLTERTDYISHVGRQYLYFQYRHNSPNDRRIDPSPNNIMDLYIITKQYSDNYLSYIRDTSNSIAEPQTPLSEELKLSYGSGPTSLENFKALSDTLVYNSGRFKPLFGVKAPIELQATFKVVKNPNIVVSDNDIKTSVVAAINAYFDTENWDFGETFYFSELSTYLHNTLAPNIASIIIVPNDTQITFGSLMQISANPDEILISAATVDNVEIITAITAAQLNQTLAGING